MTPSVSRGRARTHGVMMPSCVLVLEVAECLLVYQESMYIHISYICRTHGDASGLGCCGVSATYPQYHASNLDILARYNSYTSDVCTYRVAIAPVFFAGSQLPIPSVTQDERQGDEHEGDTRDRLRDFF